MVSALGKLFVESSLGLKILLNSGPFSTILINKYLNQPVSDICTLFDVFLNSWVPFAHENTVKIFFKLVLDQFSY